VYQSQDAGEDGQRVLVDEYAVLNGADAPEKGLPLGPLVRKIGLTLGLQPQPETFDGTVRGEGIFSPLGTHGAFGADGRTPSRPPHFSGAENLLLGWVESVKDPGASVSLAPVQTSRRVLRLELPDGEYAVIENRARRGFDAALPGEGLLVWRVKGTRINLVEADGRGDIDSNGGEASHYFPNPAAPALTVGSFRLRDIRRDEGGAISFALDRLE